MADTLLHVRLSIPVPVESGLIAGKTWLLQAIAEFEDRLVLAFGGRGTTKHTNMGRIASEIRSRGDGTFLIELGAVLSDRLPTLNEQHEYCVTVPSDDGQAPKELCFSNQIVRVRFLRNHEFHHVIAPLYRLREVQENESLAPPNAHVEYLPTVATARYSIEGADADDALSKNLQGCIGDFIGRLNRVMAAHLMVAPDEAGILTPTYDYGSFDHIYLLIVDVENQKAHAERVVLSLFRAALIAQNYEKNIETRFRAHLAGEAVIEDVARLLRSAKSYIEGGVLHLALLQLAIAAEVATTRYIHDEYIKRGVSKGKLDARKAEITFSIMLNIELMALAPDDQKPDIDLVGQVDRVRRLRNDLMHSGTFSASTDDLRSLYESVRRYVQYIECVTSPAA